MSGGGSEPVWPAPAHRTDNKLRSSRRVSSDRVEQITQSCFIIISFYSTFQYPFNNGHFLYTIQIKEHKDDIYFRPLKCLETTWILNFQNCEIEVRVLSLKSECFPPSDTNPLRFLLPQQVFFCPFRGIEISSMLGKKSKMLSKYWNAPKTPDWYVPGVSRLIGDSWQYHDIQWPRGVVPERAGCQLGERYSFSVR